MKNILMIVSIITFAAISNAKENTSADAQAVDNACTQEGTTAGCGNEKVGTGLLKCIHGYKKAHKDFKISEGCHAAMKQMHTDRKAKK